MIKTTWKYDLKYEALRLIEIAYLIKTGFYAAKGFTVLPKFDPKSSAAIIVFPKLNYFKIHRFWEKVLKIDYYHFPIKAREDLVKDVMNLIIEELPEPNLNTLKKTWEASKKEILYEISLLMPDKKIKQVDIYTSNIGAGCAFNLEKGSRKIKMYIRNTAKISSIVFAILSSLTREDVFTKYGGSWEESQTLVDWLMGDTNLNKIIKKYSTFNAPTVKKLRTKQNGKVLEKTRTYLKMLGIPEGLIKFSYHSQEIFANDAKVNKLSDREKVLLKTLIDKSNLVVNNEELMNVLDVDNDNVSLYSVSKSIERLRNKLEKNGISGVYIQAVRGKGYMLQSS